jgi:DNA transposition AAA+ family ATPase
MLRDEQPITEELAKAVVERFDRLIKRLDKSAEWASRSLGISGSTLSQVLSGTYAGDAEKQLRKIDKWTEQQILRETAPRPAGFVRTKVAEQIYGVSRWVQKTSAIGLVHGPAGVGKTITLQAIRAETPGSIYVRINSAGTSKMAVLDSIATALRMGGLKLNANRIYQALVEPGGPLHETNRLIIVDEIHKLEGKRKDEALHSLRDLHDDTGCPMLWAGMTNIATYIQSGKTRFEPLDQIFSRIGFWLNLSEQAQAKGLDGGGCLFSVEDIRKWLNGQKIRVTDDGVRYLQMLANTPGVGGLRACYRLLQIAIGLVPEDKTIDASVLKEIRGQQLGVRASEQTDRQMEMRIAMVG